MKNEEIVERVMKEVPIVVRPSSQLEIFLRTKLKQAIEEARKDEKERVVRRITRLIEGIAKDRWWHIDQNYEKPSEAVLAALKCLKKSISGERGNEK